MRFDKKQLCTGDLEHYIDIQSRSLGINAPGVTSPSEIFTSIKNVWAGIQTSASVSGGMARFSKINVNPNATHVFFIYYDVDLAKLETGNNFVLYDGERYRILTTRNQGELNEMLALETTNRGDATKTASDA
jgi:hypothetical protein